MAFSFGATPAPAASGTTSSSGGGGGFTFGSTAANATPAPATTPATAPATSGGFSFGASTTAPTATAPVAVPTTTTNNSNPAATASATAATNSNPTFSFAAASSSSSANNAPPSSNTASTTTSTPAAIPASAAVATVPTYESIFPFFGIHTKLEHILNKLHEFSTATATATTTTSNLDIHELHLQGQELIHLLSCSNTASSTTTTTSNPNNHNEPVGQLLCNPLQSLIATCRNSMTGRDQDYVPNMTLRQQLTSNLTLQFPSPTHIESQSSTPTPTPTTPTQIPPSMLKDIFQLSDQLQIPELHAASLYTVIRSCTCTSQTLEKHLLGDDTTQWFVDRHTRPNRLHSFMNDVIDYAIQNDTYVGSSGSTKRRSHKSKMENGKEDVEMKLSNEIDEKNEPDYVQMAMDLYFTERSKCLQSILLLIQHRVSVYSSSSSFLSSMNNTQEQQHNDDTHDDNTNDIPQNKSIKMVLESTDQLLQSNLISNLVALIRQMTMKIDETGKKICMALDRKEERTSSNNGNPSLLQPLQMQQQQQQQNTTFGGFGFTSPTPNATTTTTTTINNITQVQDVDYAFYEFAIRQRQIASECLFYLTYHTQCTSTEITTIIDLLQDLTNGKSKKATISVSGSNNDGCDGIGSGLPTLDAIRDVPDPYKLSWVSSSSSSSTSSNLMTPSISNPQQQKIAKNRTEWENELVSSLTSVRGLTNATITTLHTDFSGRQMYHATPLGTIVEQSSMNNDGQQQQQQENSEIVVDGGLPQLLQCVTTLILSVVCSLDVKNTLIDRSIHGPNTFGVGNALFPPDLHMQNPMDIHEGIIGINQRLDPNSARFLKWKRKDIAGLISAAYALFLRPSTTTFTSPQKSPRERSSSSGSSSSSAVYQMFRSCLQIPTVTKAFTFARLTLIGSLGMPSMRSSSTILDNDFSFYISVLSDFTSQYLDAISSFSELPISRAKWMETELQELQVRQVQENQRRQLNAWSGQTYQEVDIPKEVDIFQRPDCLDDIIALAVAVCSTCPMCANRFWSTCEQIVESHDGSLPDKYVLELRPSRSLKKLEKMQAKDPSLLPVYLSFLSAIGLFESQYDGSNSMNGATAVYDWLSNPTRVSSSPTSYRDEVQPINWEYVLNAIRWYTQQLNPPQEESKRDSWSTTKSNYNQTDSDQATGYYYGTEPTGNDESSSRQSSGQSIKSSGTAKNVPRELDAISSATLMSLLTLLSNVAYKSDDARRQILKIRLTVPGNKRFFIDEDDALTILFSLLVTSISSELRGMALNAISNLVRFDESKLYPEEEKTKDLDVVKRCWELLELSQLIPINKFSQYSSVDSNRVRSILTGGLSNLKDCWFPKSEQNGIVYEMEYIESKNGSYPATEGLLKLLEVLFSSGMAPSNLGATTRTIPGCSPYIEYVMDFVLPRALGTNKDVGSLYFFSSSDKSRLLTRALEVVNAVLIRYSMSDTVVGNQQIVPSLISENVPQDMALVEKREEHKKEWKPLTRPKSLSLVHDDIYPSEKQLSYHADFETASAPSKIVRRDQKVIPSQSKSPGFLILSDLLSSDGSLLAILLQILDICSDLEGIDRNYQKTITQSFSLFGEIQPQYSTAKDARDLVLDHHKSGLDAITVTSIPAECVETFLSPLFKRSIQNAPHTDQLSSNADSVHCEDDVMWKEHCMLLVLRILCATAGRNNEFKQRINASHQVCRVVPVLNFRRKEFTSFAPLEVKTIQVENLSKLITQNQSFLPLLAFYVGYVPLTLNNECSIATAALSIISYMEQEILPVDYARYMNGLKSNDKDKIAESYSTRLSLVNIGKENTDHFKIGQAILDQISSYLSQNMVSEQNLCHVILGFSSRSIDEKRDYLWQSFQSIDVEWCQSNNILDTMISLLSDVNFILDPESSYLASKCFEIMYRICSNEETFFQVTKLCIISKLRRLSFWQSQMLRFLGRESMESYSILNTILARSPIHTLFGKEDEIIVKRDSDLIHSTSWILKAVAHEFYGLMGYGANEEILNCDDTAILSSISPQPTKCRELLQLLFGQPSAVIINTLLTLPVEKPKLAMHLLAEAPYQNIIDLATCAMEDPVDVCRGYQVVNIAKLNTVFDSSGTFNTLENQKDRAIEWAEKWNSYMKFSCASSHLCHSWYLLSQTAFMYSQSLTEFNGGAAVNVLQTLLSQLNSSITSKSDLYNKATLEYETSGQLESANVFHLSSLCPTLIELMISTDFVMSEESCQLTLLQLFGAIVSCDEGAEIEEALNNKRAAELCCALIALLESDKFKCFDLLSAPSSRPLYEEAKNVVTYLGKLSTLTMVEMPIEGPSDLKFISYMARSALTSIIHWFGMAECTNDASGNGRFLLDFFPSSSLSTVYSQNGYDFIPACLSLLKSYDNDIVDLLEQVASFEIGTELLLNHGISKILVSISQKFLAETQENSAAIHTYGSVGVEVPNFLINHFSLINTMLSTHTSQSVRIPLMADVLVFLQIHSSNLERLLLGFPNNNELILNFASMMYNVSSHPTHMRTTMHLQHRSHDWFVQLERNVLNLANHLANYPLPIKYLVKLPKRLINAKSAVNRHYQKSSNAEKKCWWDAVDSKVENDIIVPEPVVMGLKFSMVGASQDDSWSIAKYEVAIAATRFLDKCLSYLISLVTQHQEIPFEFVSLLSSICQYCNLYQIVGGRLSKIKAESESYLLNKFSNMMEGKNDLDRLRYFNDIEAQTLESFSSLIHTCMNKLLYLTKMKYEMNNYVHSGESKSMMADVFQHIGVSAESLGLQL